jgi:NDP-sugar pyrophosphorylase family protein
MSRNVAAIIPCLGEASRMRPLSLLQPKVFLPFCGRPLLEYTLHQLIVHKIRNIVLIAGHGDNVADRYIAWGQRHSANIIVVRRGLEYGSGGVIQDVTAQTRSLDANNDFLVVYADSLLAIDFSRMIEAHRAKLRGDCLVTVATHKPADLAPIRGRCSNYGVCRLDHSGRIVRFAEKPDAEHIGPCDVASTGILVLNRHVFHRFPKGRPLDLSRDVLEFLATGARSPVSSFDIGSGFRYDVGTMEEFVRKQFALLRNELRVPGIRLHGIRKQGGISGGGKVIGKAIIGPGCRVATGGALKGLNVLGRDVFVGRGSNLEDSVVLDHVRVGERVSISGSVLGSHCSVGDGVVLKPGTVLGDYTRVV